MALKPFCDTCQRRDKSWPASKFCSDCEDALCTECVNVHNTFKAFASHHVVDINLATDESYSVDKYCSKHREMILELYCSDHDTLCCRSCMVIDHRTCEKLLPLDVASKNVKSSSLFQDASSDVEHLIQTSNQLSGEKNKIQIDLKESKEMAKKNVAKFKEALLTRINEIEKKSLSDIDSVFSDLSKQVDKEDQGIEMRIQSIREITNRFQFVTNHGSDSQIFRLLHSIKSDMSKVDKDLEEYIPSLRLRTVEIDYTDLLPLIKTLASITVKENPCNINYKRLKNQHAQMLQIRERVLTKLELETKVSVTEGQFISGMCITTDSRLILCKSIDRFLVVLTDTGQFIQKISLPAYPWSIAIDPKSDDAWCTLPEENYVQIINSKTYQPIRQVNLKGKGYYGIAFIDDQVALGGIGRVNIINKQGVVTKSLSMSDGVVHSIFAAGTMRLYCCQANKRILHCIALDGSSLFTYSSPELGGPTGITQDSSGKLYVVSYNKHNLHKISPSGKFMDIMLQQENGLQCPYCLCFNRDYSKLFIPNYGDNNLLILKCIYSKF